MLEGGGFFQTRAGLRPCGQTTFRSVSEAGRLPGPGRRQLGIGRQLNMMSLGPGEVLFGAEAAAVPPAFLGCLTTTRMFLTGERLARILMGKFGEWETDGGAQISKQGHAGTDPVREVRQEAVSSRPSHRLSCLLAETVFNPP